MTLQDRLTSMLTPPEGWPRVLADLARPYAMAVVATATAHAIFTGRPEGLVVAAGAILVALYGARGIENERVASHAAKVDVAKVKGETEVKVAEAATAPPVQP